MKTHISKKLSGIITAMFLFQISISEAQNSNKSIEKNKGMKAVITRYEVKKENQEKFQKAISDYVNASLLEENNIMSEAYFEQENQSVIWLFERWTNENMFDTFRNSEKAKSVKTLIKTTLVKPEKVIYVKDLEPISKQEWRRTSKTEDKQLTIMLFVDAKKGTEENFMKVYHKAMPEFRSEPGVVTYQLSQFIDDNSQFVTFEKFRSNDAFQYHLNFPPIQPVIDYLNTSIKKQPFQDGIHNLIEFAPLTRE
ncbi:putative quinol monooxygenase [Flavobacterium defluvii]|uniref:Quinol monooxygenase YgiN n=1 Tax=Flavobacterium defluvii TaxID=370979 RepID=A0A1M5IQR1_9FLAO|nr:antibiotic biosynthesis monooxygenase family protein [Flavobacterium defluvii]SHG30555.1 Quinol monooxygenase YgiN [Flavobacterium defluvii]